MSRIDVCTTVMIKCFSCIGFDILSSRLQVRVATRRDRHKACDSISDELPNYKFLDPSKDSKRAANT